MEYEDGIFEKFDQAVSDVETNDNDPTLLFIATDGSRVYKAFTGPEEAVGENDPAFARGFDDDVFIGIWSLGWLRDRVKDIELKENPDDEWGALMQDMVLSLADFADQETPPAVGSC